MNSQHTVHIYKPKLKVGTIFSPSFEMYNVNELCAKRKSENAVVVRFQIENGMNTLRSKVRRTYLSLRATAAADFNVIFKSNFNDQGESNTILFLFIGKNTGYFKKMT